MDAATQRATRADPATTPEEPLADAEPHRRSRRARRSGGRRERRVNPILLAVALVATIAGAGFLALDGSTREERPAVGASDTAGTRSAAPPTESVTEPPVPTDAVAPTERPVLSEGSAGPDVVDLQERLAALGLDPGAIDGRFGPRTTAAVRELQASTGLAPDGVVGPETWARVTEASEPEGAASETT